MVNAPQALDQNREINKWKAWLNVHGGQQDYGMHYWETYTPVVT